MIIAKMIILKNVAAQLHVVLQLVVQELLLTDVAVHWIIHAIKTDVHNISKLSQQRVYVNAYSAYFNMVTNVFLRVH